MVQPVVSAEVVLHRNAQLNLAAVVNKLQDQIVAIKVKTGPYLSNCVVAHHQSWLLLPLSVYRQTTLVDDAYCRLPPSEKR